jgi:hypothetical protein
LEFECVKLIYFYNRYFSNWVQFRHYSPFYSKLYGAISLASFLQQCFPLGNYWEELSDNGSRSAAVSLPAPLPVLPAEQHGPGEAEIRAGEQGEDNASNKNIKYTFSYFVMAMG